MLAPVLAWVVLSSLVPQREPHPGLGLGRPTSRGQSWVSRPQGCQERLLEGSIQTSICTELPPPLALPRGVPCK